MEPKDTIEGFCGMTFGVGRQKFFKRSESANILGKTNRVCVTRAKSELRVPQVFRKLGAKPKKPVLASTLDPPTPNFYHSVQVKEKSATIEKPVFAPNLRHLFRNMTSIIRSIHPTDTSPIRFVARPAPLKQLPTHKPIKFYDSFHQKIRSHRGFSHDFSLPNVTTQLCPKLYSKQGLRQKCKARLPKVFSRLRTESKVYAKVAL